jgi:hypothetical protein
MVASGPSTRRFVRFRLGRVAEIHQLPAREHFTDDRGTGLQATWHPEAGLIILSIWHGDRCAASYRLPIGDAPRLGALILSALGDAASPASASSPRTNSSTAVNGD